MKVLRFCRLRTTVLVVLAMFVLLGGMAVAAQSADLTIPRASLQLWPEYDDPGLLVIFSGDFATTVAFPQQVTFPVMPGARDIQATANDPEKGLLSQVWQLDGNKLIYTLPQPGFQVEYYLDRPPSGDAREIKYTFEAPYPIGSLDIAIQQPPRATGFTVTPQSSGTEVRSDGLTYHLISRENLKAGDKLEIAISYTKTDSALTSPQLAVSSGTPSAAGAGASTAQPASAAAGVFAANWLPYLLIGLGLLVLVGLGAYWFLRQQQTVEPSPKAKRTPPPGEVRTPAGPPVTGGAAFCTQCGHRLGPDDRFCAQCGAIRKG